MTKLKQFNSSRQASDPNSQRSNLHAIRGDMRQRLLLREQRPTGLWNHMHVVEVLADFFFWGWLVTVLPAQRMEVP